MVQNWSEFYPKNQLKTNKNKNSLLTGVHLFDLTTKPEQLPKLSVLSPKDEDGTITPVLN